MDVLREISTLKERAMLFRDDGDYEDAIETLDEAEQRILSELGQFTATSEGPGRYELSLRKQLYTIRGSKGGVYRRWKHLPDAIASYDAGYEVERSFEDSYNLTQRLVTRVMQDPQSVAGEGGIVAGVAVRDELRRAGETIRAQKRHDDEYAAADLLTILLLLGDPGWRHALQEFLRRADTASYAREVTKKVFEEIAEYLEPGTPFARDLDEARARL